MVNTHIMVKGFDRKQGKITTPKRETGNNTYENQLKNTYLKKENLKTTILERGNLKETKLKRVVWQRQF